VIHHSVRYWQDSHHRTSRRDTDEHNYVLTRNHYTAGSDPATLPLLLVVGIVSSSVVGFGEEVGFRGYLLPQLAALGRGRALLLSGLLHAIWHLPILLLHRITTVRATC